MVDERNDKRQQHDADRVATVLGRAIDLSSKLTDTVAELADLLKNYDKEQPSGK